MVEEASATALELHEAGLKDHAGTPAQSSVRDRHEQLMRQIQQAAG